VFTRTPDTFRRSLERVRRSGASIGVTELARDLLALDAPIDPALARRIVATVLGWSEASLPDRIQARHVRPAEEAAVADVRLSEAEFVVVDLETTGLSVSRSSILEIAAVRVSRLRPAGQFQTLVRPPAPVSRAIADLTGIDDAMLAEAPALRPAVGAFRRWLERVGPAPFVAHNARFDAGFVKRALDELGLPPLRAPVLCTQRLARRVLPGLGRYNLDRLCAHFGIRNPARHRALGDARATVALLVELLHLARVREGLETIGDLLDLADRPIRSAPRGRRPAGEARDRSR
jgi:DNA polymerase III epsilon subunit family exonuclease